MPFTKASGLTTRSTDMGSACSPAGIDTRGTGMLAESAGMIFMSNLGSSKSEILV